MPTHKKGSTKRIQRLMEGLYQHAASDRSDEWFTEEMLPDIAAQRKDSEDTPIIIRRARAFSAMLKSMADEKNSEQTHTYDIRPGELIVGTMPLGSLGCGKVFPNYLSAREKEVAFFSARSIDSVLAHNVPDFNRVLDGGLRNIIEICNERLKSLRTDFMFPIGTRMGIEMKIEFYEAVKICCSGIVDYAHRFAALAGQEAQTEKDGQRKAELREIARICRKVPYEPADGYYEALHSIWIVHLALHASASHLSLGRMDQILQPYYAESMENPKKYAIGEKEFTKELAQEIFECFLIKGAERMILNTTNLVEQDHADFSTGMGANPFLVDQEVTVNQFMQNIVVGGQTREGQDATNDCTYLIIDACTALGLPTPVLNVRLHKGSPEDLVQKVAESAVNAGNGQPIVYNDESIISGLKESPKLPIEEVRDYVVDGCWETLLNAKCDFNYNMVNILTVLECALNGGAGIVESTLQLRGPKKSFMSTMPSKIRTFEELQKIVRQHLRYFTNKAGLELYSYYMLESSTTPTPFFSALLGQCLEKGIDKTWGGADYILGGMVFIGMPNAANALTAIKEWVFEKEVYTLDEVVKALKNDFDGYRQMREDLTRSATFGNNDDRADGMMKWLMDSVHDAVKYTEDLCDQVFLTRPRSRDERKRIERLRKMAGYPGPDMRTSFGKNFEITLSVGCGTFAQYVFFGTLTGTSADGRHSGAPVAPNFSPVSGTAVTGAGAVLSSLKNLGLDRFGLGVMVDMCFDREETSPEFMVEVVRKFMEYGGSIVSLTIVNQEDIKKAHELCNEVRIGKSAPEVLFPYNHITVRAGGWNSPFVALTKAQQEDYLKRSLGHSVPG
ncbi:MAG: formate acetyltransferase [Fidelibacterota bacterium]|nr:MAG: formate acetyltransferase [Candidatus Neomarinimicrobiota bacterium]